MDSVRPGSPQKNFYSLKEAADYIAVSTDVLIAWNKHDILKPTVNPTGEVVYTKDQLDKFKTIQNFSNHISHEKENPQHLNANRLSNNQQSRNSSASPHQQLNNYSQINNYHFHSNSSPTPTKEYKAYISVKKLSLTLSVFALILITVIITQQSNLTTLFSDEEVKGIAYDSHSAVIETTNDNIQNEKLSNKGEDIAKSENSNLNEALEKSSDPRFKNSDNKNLAAIKTVAENAIDESSINIESKSEVVTYGQKTNLRTTSNYNKSDTENQVFDTEGNIKELDNEPTEKELLATALGAPGLSQSQDLVRQNTNSVGLVTFIILGLLFVYFLYSSRKQLIPNTGGYNNNLRLQPVTQSSQPDLDWEKILEVDQKTDGSVMIIFHGKEYKISKPELDSESDKFIERLMQITKNGSKEIEYDILADEALNLTTPLSKIVTRLGFVGIKRDLFFPRTSKSRVLFRKYLTLDDLFSMNLTVEDLSDKFNKIN